MQVASEKAAHSLSTAIFIRIGRRSKMSRNKPNILVNTEQWRMTDESIAALQSSDEIFQCNGMLSRILTDAYKKDGVTFEDGTPRIGRLPAPTLSETLSKKARYYS